MGGRLHRQLIRSLVVCHSSVRELWHALHMGARCEALEYKVGARRAIIGIGHDVRHCTVKVFG